MLVSVMYCRDKKGGETWKLCIVKRFFYFMAVFIDYHNTNSVIFSIIDLKLDPTRAYVSVF